MTAIQPYAVLAGRMGIALIFVLSGAGKILDFSGTSEQMAEAGMPLVSLLLVGAIVFEIVGGLSVMTGFRARIGALLLIVFLIPASLIFHNFWTLEGEAAQTQMIMFLKNVSIGGGLLLIVGMGSGPMSLDNRKRASSD